ncbi:MAG: DUF5076 domain-containing protein [Brevundimonas sp.]|uniref:DUF5076 domain-containing protein n=1 Tax=Brevundimonas sp. TaxID=1871086 RepID=UPI00391873B3
MSHPYALPEPAGVETAPADGSVLELARVWLSPNGPAIMVRAAYDDPRAMGMMLAELCWHFAYAYEQKGGLTQRQALEALKRGWLEGHANGDAAEQQGTAR